MDRQQSGIHPLADAAGSESRRSDLKRGPVEPFSRFPRELQIRCGSLNRRRDDMPEKSQVAKLREEVDDLKGRVAGLEDRLDSFQEVIRPEAPASAVSQHEVFTEQG